MAEEYAFGINEDSMKGVGICGVCSSVFERPKHVPMGHPGYFCPVCREDGRVLVGVVSFTPDTKLNKLPLEVSTA